MVDAKYADCLQLAGRWINLGDDDEEDGDD